MKTDITNHSSPWQVLHLRSRCEKKAAAYCAAAGLTHYLPLRREKKKYQRRQVEVWIPLFPGYLFVQLHPEQRALILRSGQVARILEVKDQLKFVSEIEQIRKALEAEPGLSACPAITAGQMVRITAGPFQGLEGIVAKDKGGERVILNVEMIGQGVAIEAAKDILERL